MIPFKVTSAMLIKNNNWIATSLLKKWHNIFRCLLVLKTFWLVGKIRGRAHPHLAPGAPPNKPSFYFGSKLRQGRCKKSIIWSTPSASDLWFFKKYIWPQIMTLPLEVLEPQMENTSLLSAVYDCNKKWFWTVQTGQSLMWVVSYHWWAALTGVIHLSWMVDPPFLPSTVWSIIHAPGWPHRQ